MLGAIVVGTATNWPGGGYDPENHIVFAPAGNMAGYAVDRRAAARVLRYPIRGRRRGTEVPGSPGARRLLRGRLAANGGQGSRGADRGDRSAAGSTRRFPPPTSGSTCRVCRWSKPPYGLLAAINLDRGEVMWQTPHGDTPDNIRLHPLLKGMNIPKTGQPGTQGVGLLVTKTLVIMGDPQITAPPGRQRGAMLRAYNKMTGQQVGEVWMPAPQSGSPMTYRVDGRQYIVVAVSGGPYSGEYLAFSLPTEAVTTSQ